MSSLVKWLRRLCRPTQPLRARPSRCPALEALEDRRLLTAYTVTTTRDMLNDVSPGQVTLRDVLTAISTQRRSGNAPAGTATNSVAFAIGAAGSVQTIRVASGLPALTHQAVIDGWTQGGGGYAGPPLIVLNGAAAPPSSTNGLNLFAGSSGSTVRGLSIQQFGLEGIDLRASSNDLILGDWIGVNTAGTARLGSNVGGVLLSLGATNNTVGGTAAGTANVIAANGPGVEIKDAGTGGNVVLGNLIGTNATGTAFLGTLAGVEIRNLTTGNTVGGTAAGSANVIAANGPGVELMDAGTSGNVVLGNLIGTDATGTARLGVLAGVEVRGKATGNTVGGTSAGAANVISGSKGPGVEIKDLGTSGNVVLGNRIGTDKAGTATIGNAVGVEVRMQARANTIGGTSAGSANVISGNGLGVEIKDAGTSGNVVLGNEIGTDVSGTSPLGNTTFGVLLRAGAASNTVGGTAAASGNAIAFNAKGVVLIDNATVGDSILGNSIWGNTGPGIDLGNDGPTPNGVNPRAFPNRGQNTPILTARGAASLSGTLTSIRNTTFRVEFFATPAGGPANQGQVFLGSMNVTTNAQGGASFTAPVMTIPIGSVVTATATNLVTGDTSEFSPPK
jgi:hypothetical protein